MGLNRILSGGFLLCVLAACANAQYPQFAARRDFTGLFTQYVTVADTNGDGNPDLVVTDQGYVTVLFGNGRGNFEIGPGQNTIAQGSFMNQALDLNGDGKVDLVLLATPNGEENNAGIAVCLGNGDGTFQNGVFYPAGNEEYSTSGGMTVGDFTGDGIPDVIVATATGLWLFKGHPDGTFDSGVMAAPLEFGVGSIASEDLNGDGKLDVVVAMTIAGLNNVGDGFKVFFGNGNGAFQAPLSFSNPKKPVTVITGPLVAGGPSAIVMTIAFSAYSAIFISNGVGGFRSPQYAYLPNQRGIALGDLNGDGYSDLVSSLGDIAFGAGNGKFPEAASYAVDSGGSSFNVALADLRHKGRLDIVTDSQYGISVLLNTGKGTFEDGNWTPVTGGGLCAAAADFNGDGKPDIAMTNNTGISILLGTGSTVHPLKTGVVLPESGAGCPAIGDLNGDGIPDLAVHSQSGVVPFLGHGDGTFTQKSITATAVDGHTVLADFNHNGKLDFISSANLLAYGNGDGTFRKPIAFVSNPPAAGFSYIATGDLNNDGWPDVVLTNVDIPYRNVYVLLNNHQGGFTQVPASFGALTNTVVLADLNGDGNLDMVLGPLGGSGAAIYLGDGKGGFTAGPQLRGPASGGGNNIVTDLNGDGIPDIAVLGGNTVAIYTGKGNATYEPVTNFGGSPSPSFLLSTDLHGQAPAADTPDLVLPDFSGGVTLLFNITQ